MSFHVVLSYSSRCRIVDFLYIESMIILSTKDASAIESKLNSYLGKQNNICCWIETAPDKWIGRVLTGFSHSKFIIINDIAEFESASQIMIRNEDYDAIMRKSVGEQEKCYGEDDECGIDAHIPLDAVYGYKTGGSCEVSIKKQGTDKYIRSNALSSNDQLTCNNIRKFYDVK